MHMREDGALRLHPLDPGQRLLHAEMTGMGRVTERVDDPHIEVLKEIECRLGEAADIRRIGDVAEAIAERLGRTVLLAKRDCFDDAAGAGKLDRRAGLYLAAIEDGRIVAARIGVEAITEALLELPPRLGVVIDIDAGPRVVRDLAKIIDAMRMIGMV